MALVGAVKLTIKERRNGGKIAQSLRSPVVKLGTLFDFWGPQGGR